MPDGPFSHEQIYPTDVFGPSEGDSNYCIKSVNMNVGVFVTQLLGRGSKVFSGPCQCCHC